MKKNTQLHLCLIRFLGLIVPRRLRADWRQEWEAEQHCRKLWRVNQFTVIGKIQIFEVTRRQTFAQPRRINRLLQVSDEPFAPQRWQGQWLELKNEWSYPAQTFCHWSSVNAVSHI